MIDKLGRWYKIEISTPTYLMLLKIKKPNNLAVFVVVTPSLFSYIQKVSNWWNTNWHDGARIRPANFYVEMKSVTKHKAIRTIF
jgi:hypothetical protein